MLKSKIYEGQNIGSCHVTSFIFINMHVFFNYTHLSDGIFFTISCRKIGNFVLMCLDSVLFHLSFVNTLKHVIESSLPMMTSYEQFDGVMNASDTIPDLAQYFCSQRSPNSVCHLWSNVIMRPRVYTSFGLSIIQSKS